MAERAAASETLASAGLDSGDNAAESPAAARDAPSLYGSEAYWDGRYAEASEAAADESSRDEWCVLALRLPRCDSAVVLTWRAQVRRR